MLEKQMWLKYDPDLSTEWRQHMEEGKDVESYREVCSAIEALSVTADCESAAFEIYKAMEQAAVRKDYGYQEPSSYAEIREQAPCWGWYWVKNPYRQSGASPVTENCAPVSAVIMR